MFSGKTTSLINVARSTGVDVVYRPYLDTRGSADFVTSHDGLAIKSHVLSSAPELMRSIERSQNIMIDEAQFLDSSIVNVILSARHSSMIYLSMLDRDYLGRYFDNFIKLTSEGSCEVQLRTARCEVCGREARFSHRTTESSELILCGSKDTYEPRCDLHFPMLGMSASQPEHTQARTPQSSSIPGR